MLEDSDDDDNGGWRSDECVGGVKDSAGVSDLLFQKLLLLRCATEGRRWHFASWAE